MKSLIFLCVMFSGLAHASFLDELSGAYEVKGSDCGLEWSGAPAQIISNDKGVTLIVPVLMGPAQFETEVDYPFYYESGKKTERGFGGSPIPVPFVRTVKWETSEDIERSVVTLTEGVPGFAKKSEYRIARDGDFLWFSPEYGKVCLLTKY